jgi:hypothetical protein
MKSRDITNELFWNDLNEFVFRNWLNHKKTPISRFRFTTRGESISTEKDIFKLYYICKTNEQILFWIPTRSWRNDKLKRSVEKYLFPIKNIRMSASTDPSNSDDEIIELEKTGWNVSFFGDNEKFVFKNNCIKCPKTWDKNSNINCVICENGCFNLKQTHIWYKQH